MQDILHTVETTPALLIVAIGIALVLIDILLTNDSFLAWLGIAIFGVAALNAFGASGEVQLFAFPIFTCITLGLVRRIFVSTTKQSHSPSTPETLHGTFGTIIDANNEDPSRGRVAVVKHGEWQCRSIEGDSLSTHERVRVIGSEGLTLIVQSDSSAIVTAQNSERS